MVAKVENLESGGLSQDFEIFKFDKVAQGSKIRINVRGTTAGAWNAISEASTRGPHKAVRALSMVRIEVGVKF